MHEKGQDLDINEVLRESFDSDGELALLPSMMCSERGLPIPNAPTTGKKPNSKLLQVSEPLDG